MRPVDEADFPSTGLIERWCRRVGEAGYRGTATAAHATLVDWLESELRDLGLAVRRDEFAVERWRPIPEGDLESAAQLSIDGLTVPVAGAVPYSRPSVVTGPIVHLGPDEPITPANATGRIVVRDFPKLPLTYDYLLDHALHRSPDTEELRGKIWDRPGLADSILHRDLLDAGVAGAAGVVIAFDLPREQVAGYHEPHKGTHYAVPAAFVGAGERDLLLASTGRECRLEVTAEVETATTANLHARLDGRTSERAVLITHTDGNTWVQENGIAAMLALATHLARRPERERSIDFVFTTAHLHISREGAARHAAALDGEYDDGEIAYVFPIEHLGVRELAPVASDDGTGHHLEFTGDDEVLLWSAGPSAAIRDAVRQAIEHRRLRRVVLLPGLGAPVPGQVPEIVSFGGLGTLFHMHLLPTTSVLTGPWSLWAPHFGADAIDIDLLRRHTLAIADVVATLDTVPRAAVAGEYPAMRRARADGAPVGMDPIPPEFADEHPKHPMEVS